jgi:hypothetical protein
MRLEAIRLFGGNWRTMLSHYADMTIGEIRYLEPRSRIPNWLEELFSIWDGYNYATPLEMFNDNRILSNDGSSLVMH